MAGYMRAQLGELVSKIHFVKRSSPILRRRVLMQASLHAIESRLQWSWPAGNRQYRPPSSAERAYFLPGWPSSDARSVATWIARAIVERTRPSSSARRPAIVHPPGAVCPRQRHTVRARRTHS
jgi:hypothetical protein